MVINVNNIANGVTTTDQPSQSFEIILFRMAGWMAGRPDGRLDSDNNATQPAGAGAWLSLAISHVQDQLLVSENLQL